MRFWKFYDAGLRGELEIAERLGIAIDVAHAITYLHTYTGFVNIYIYISQMIKEKLRSIK